MPNNARVKQGRIAQNPMHLSKGINAKCRDVYKSNLRACTSELRYNVRALIQVQHFAVTTSALGSGLYSAAFNMESDQG